MQKLLLEPVTVFHGLKLPEEAAPAGYAALIGTYNLAVPLPDLLCAVGTHHRVYEKNGWRIFTPRHTPSSDLEGHLVFALKYEGVNLGVLARLFDQAEARDIEMIVRQTPTGAYARRIGFLYEWLTGEKLELQDLETGRYVPVLDPNMQYGIPGEQIRRYRVINNLPGTVQFCPLVFKTPAIEKYIHEDLKSKAQGVVDAVPRDVLARAAAFLLLKDSRASYAIEGESPPHTRIERWGKILGEAGKEPLTPEELVRLQAIVLGDTRFVPPGFRTEGGFIGEHDRHNGTPLPEHISARPEDLPSLIEGIVKYSQKTAGTMHPVIAAASLAFGFVYIHPFSDGNGRIHRYLVHHVLTMAGYNPPGMILPVSAAILEGIEEYRRVLQGHSRKTLPLIEWEPTKDNNVRVLNRTDDYYRFFDATAHTEFLFSCVAQTIEKDLPEETQFLRSYDRFKTGVESVVEMPARTINLLFRFLHQNGGRLSNRAREKEFGALNEIEVERIEELYREVFSF